MGRTKIQYLPLEYCLTQKYKKFALAPCLASYTNLCIFLSLCKWTILTCVTSICLSLWCEWIIFTIHPLWLVSKKTLRKLMSQMTRRMTMYRMRRLCNSVVSLFNSPLARMCKLCITLKQWAISKHLRPIPSSMLKIHWKTGT